MSLKIHLSEYMTDEIDRLFDELINEFHVIRFANVSLFHLLEETNSYTRRNIRSERSLCP